jgi:hypothetical protein
MRNIATHRSTIRIMTGCTIGAAAAAAFNSVLWMHSESPEAPLQANIWLVLCAISVAAGILRSLYYRNRRNYFAEETDYRRTLVREHSRVESCKMGATKLELEPVVASLNPLGRGSGVNSKVPTRFSHNPREKGWGTRTMSLCQRLRTNG